MCVIVHQPAGAYLSRKTAEEMWSYNPDGGGFAYIDVRNRIQTHKAMEFEEFWKKFEPVRSRNRDSEFLVHFRIATSGEVGLDNTHPFQLDKYTVMAHNGMLNSIVGAIPITAAKSDTREFMEQVLPELPELWLDNPILVDMVEDYIGGSKLMFLTTNPKLSQNVYILNRSRGVDKHSMWWSNKNHEPVAKFVWSSGSEYKANQPRKGIPALPPAREVKIEVPEKAKIIDITAAQRAKMSASDYESWWAEIDAISTGYYELPSHKKEEKELLVGLRKIVDLEADIVFDPLEEMWECVLCNQEVDESGDCFCWELICVGCGRMAPYCLHDPEDADLWPVKQAHEAFDAKTKGANEEDPF